MTVVSAVQSAAAARKPPWVFKYELEETLCSMYLNCYIYNNFFNIFIKHVQKLSYNIQKTNKEYCIHVYICVILLNYFTKSFFFENP